MREHRSHGEPASILREASRLADWILRDIGRELRVARIRAGMGQADVAAMLRTATSHVSRVEHGLIKGLSMPAISRHAAALGLKPWVRLYPSISRPLDRAQLALLDRFRERLGTTWKIRLEVPMPMAGDLRAADAVMSIPGCRCMVEVITRLADVQAQLRIARLKNRDLGADRLIFVVAANATNRRALRDAGTSVTSAFPIQTKAALRSLRAGVDPGGNALILR